MTPTTATRSSRWLDRLSRARTRLEPALPVLRILTFVVAVGIVVVMAIGAVGDVKVSELTWWPLPVALVGVLAWWLLLARGWALLASGHPRMHDIAMWCRTQTLRYLPGGVWAPASRATVLHGRVIDRIATVAAENVIALCAALAIGGVCLAVSGAPLWLPLILAVAVPAVASRFVSDHTRLAPERTHRALVNYLLAFAGYAAAAVFVQAAVSGFKDPFEVAGAAALAWAVGLVVVIAPGGVGIRELTYVALLSHAFHDADLTAAAVTLRGATIVIELGVLVVAGAPDDGAARARRTLTGALALARRHAVFIGIFTAGLVMRLLSFLAYSPAIVYYDSIDYINRSMHLEPGKARPLGYSMFLKGLPGHSLAMAPAAQHLLGLAMGLLIYAVLCRLGVRRWAAALAAAPVLLDAYQLILEEFVLSETLFAFLVVAGCVAILWNRKPGILEAGLAGAMFAGAAVTRANGLIVIAPAVLTIVFLRWEGWRAPLLTLRRTVLPLVALLLAFLVPVGAYAAWFKSVNGNYAITSSGGSFLYGRVSTFADCKNFSVPPVERILCPTQAVGHRPRLQGSTVNWYTWARFGNNTSPRFKLPFVAERLSLPGRFARRAMLGQPGDYFKAVTHDFLRGFAPTRTHHGDELPIARWQFTPENPPFSKYTPQILKLTGDHPLSSRPGLGRFLRGYQRFGFTWGPILVAAVLAALLALVGLGGARRSGLRSAVFLFTAVPLALFGSTVAANTFTWRYQLILALLLPPAGALALTAILRRTTSEDPSRYPDGAGRSSTSTDQSPGGKSSEVLS